MDLIDVHDEREWQAGHVPDPRLLPLQRLGDGRGFGLASGSRPLATHRAGGTRKAFPARRRRDGAERLLQLAGGELDDLPAQGIKLTGEH